MITILILVALTAMVTAALNHPGFGGPPRGKRLERIRRSPNYRDGIFQNLHPTPTITMENG